jgi:hypothetical protein
MENFPNIEELLKSYEAPPPPTPEELKQIFEQLEYNGSYSDNDIIPNEPAPAAPAKEIPKEIKVVQSIFSILKTKSGEDYPEGLHRTLKLPNSTNKDGETVRNWITDYEIDKVNLDECLTYLGFGYFYPDKLTDPLTWLPIKIEGKIAIDSNKDEQLKTIKNIIYTNDKYFSNLHKEVFRGSFEVLYSQPATLFLPEKKNIGYDKLDPTVWKVWKNCVIRVKDNGEIDVFKYSELPFIIRKGDIFDRDFDVKYLDTNPLNSYVAQFLDKILTHDRTDADKRMSFDNGVSTFGYHVSHYKDEANARMTIFQDRNMKTVEGEANGGTGKSLSIECIKRFLSPNQYIEIAKFDSNNRFVNQIQTIHTILTILPDMPSGFNLRGLLYAMITNDTPIEKKNRDLYNIPFKYSSKLIGATNFEVHLNGYSDERRLNIIEVAKVWNSQKSYTPEIIFNGKFWGKTWTEKHWNEYDWFMIYCTAFFNKHGLILSSEGNTKIKQLINDSNKAFSEFIPTIKLNEPFTHENLLDRFKNSAPDTWNDKINGELSVNTFIKWINKYCQLNGLKKSPPKQTNGNKREYYLFKD